MTGSLETVGLDYVAVRSRAIQDEVERAVIGKRAALELALCALLADGHALIELWVQRVDADDVVRECLKNVPVPATVPEV